MIWFESTIMLRAVVGCVLAGLLTGLVGVFVVRMKLSSIGYCMSHGAFAGAALGVAAAVDPLMTALLFASATALFIGPVADKARLHADVITSIVFPLNMALAFVFLTFSPQVGLKSDVANVLWGSVLSMTNSDAVYLSALCAATVALVYLFWKELFAVMFDRKMAEADGISTKPFLYFITFLAGLVVTLSLKLVGGLLIFALLFNPASSALQFLDNIRNIVVASPIIGAATCVAGLMLSLLVDLPIGSSIVIVSSAVFAVAVLLSPKRRRGEVTSPA